VATGLAGPYIATRPERLGPTSRLGGPEMKLSWKALAALAIVTVAQPAEAGGGATITAKVRLAKDLPNQVADLYRSYLGAGSAIYKGDLFLELCEDAACKKVVAAKKVINYVFSTGFPKDVSVADLPAGKYYARFGLDTAYSQQYDGAYDKQHGFGELDLLQSAGADPRPKTNDNPPETTKEITLAAGKSVSLGEVVLGTIVFRPPATPPAPEKGYLLAAASSESGFRNQIDVVDLEAWKMAAAAVPKVAGKDFQGDLCGFVKGEGSDVYTIGVGNDGAYVFAFDSQTRAFAKGEPISIPHPDCKNGMCPAKLDPVNYPWPCRGTMVKKGGKTLLYLVDFKGAGAMPTTMAYALTVVDATGLAQGQKGSVVATYPAGSSPFVTTKRLFRGVGAVGDTLYLVEPSWSKQLADDKIKGKTVVYSVPIGADGKVDFGKRKATQVDPADDTCGSTNNWIPGFTVQSFAGGPKLFVGTDAGVTLLNPDGTKLGDLDGRDYGTLVTSFGLGPDGKTLYGMPNCKSSTKKAKVQQGVGSKRTNLDRHAVLVMDLGSGGKAPALKETARDFDEDGQPDGGIDLEFLFLKRNLLRWCETCTGVVPPTAYTGPEIAVGTRSLFLRGSGIQGDGQKGGSISSSGLGQVGDLGVYDLGSGRGVLFRQHNLWMDGPSSRWGFDLHPKNASKSYDDDQSVSAVMWVPKK
jgi:hypothetical protein